MNRVKRALLAALVGFTTALIVALGLTVVDLYLSGHGMPTLSRGLADLSMSWADLILLGTVLAAVIGTWSATKPA